MPANNNKSMLTQSFAAEVTFDFVGECIFMLKIFVLCQIFL